MNYPIQGGAASVQMLALRRVYDVLAGKAGLEAQVVAAIHDELIFEAPADERADDRGGHPPARDEGGAARRLPGERSRRWRRPPGRGRGARELG